MLVTEKTSEASEKLFFHKNLAVATMMGFLNGAYDTTHSTTFWLLYHLARYPHVQTELATKIITHLKGRFWVALCGPGRRCLLLEIYGRMK